jgi:hypothetical protein
MTSVIRSAVQIIDAIYSQRVAYDETRLLYIGIFSRTPNNVYSPNYTELLHGIIERFYEEDKFGSGIFEMLFLLQSTSRDALEQVKGALNHPSYSGKVDRLYSNDSLPYRSFVSILALCAAVNVNLTERGDDILGFQLTKDFIENSRNILEGDNKKRFIRYYTMACKVWIQEVIPSDVDDATIQRDMATRSKRANFSGLLRTLHSDIDFFEKMSAGS